MVQFHYLQSDQRHFNGQSAAGPVSVTNIKTYWQIFIKSKRLGIFHKNLYSGFTTFTIVTLRQAVLYFYHFLIAIDLLSARRVGNGGENVF